MPTSQQKENATPIRVINPTGIQLENKTPIKYQINLGESALLTPSREDLLRDAFKTVREHILYGKPDIENIDQYDMQEKLFIAFEMINAMQEKEKLLPIEEQVKLKVNYALEFEEKARDAVRRADWHGAGSGFFVAMDKFMEADTITSGQKLFKKQVRRTFLEARKNIIKEIEERTKDPEVIRKLFTFALRFHNVGYWSTLISRYSELSIEDTLFQIEAAKILGPEKIETIGDKKFVWDEKGKMHNLRIDIETKDNSVIKCVNPQTDKIRKKDLTSWIREASWCLDLIKIPTPSGEERIKQVIIVVPDEIEVEKFEKMFNGQIEKTYPHLSGKIHLWNLNSLHAFQNTPTSYSP